ncbi:unnamed protein product [Gadus morhua 'NCC']
MFLELTEKWKTLLCDTTFKTDALVRSFSVNFSNQLQQMKTGATSPAREVFWQATEGNTELQSFLTAGSVDWKTELERNRQLTSRTELQTKESGSHQSLYKDGAMAGSSYDFLKSILGEGLCKQGVMAVGRYWNRSGVLCYRPLPGRQMESELSVSRQRCLEKASLDYG